MPSECHLIDGMGLGAGGMGDSLPAGQRREGRGGVALLGGKVKKCLALQVSRRFARCRLMAESLTKKAARQGGLFFADSVYFVSLAGGGMTPGSRSQTLPLLANLMNSATLFAE